MDRVECDPYGVDTTSLRSVVTWNPGGILLV